MESYGLDNNFESSDFPVRVAYRRRRPPGISLAEAHFARLANFGGAALTSPQRRLKRSRSMRIVVDLNRCLGYAQCVPLAPEVLQLQGEEALAYDPNPDDSQRQRVARAVASCPVQAIIAEMDPPADRTTK
jgi:ferredoxin